MYFDQHLGATVHVGTESEAADFAQIRVYSGWAQQMWEWSGAKYVNFALFSFQQKYSHVLHGFA